MFAISPVIFFVITILLMGFFAGIEMAFYSANRLTLEVRKKQGGMSGRILAQFVESPDHFLGTTLIGYNIFLIFFSLILSYVMEDLVWEKFHIESGLVRVICEITIATVIILIFAEFIPRAIFRARSTTLLTRLALVTDFFYQCSIPLQLVLSALHHGY
jgi:putative hemolysin